MDDNHCGDSMKCPAASHSSKTTNDKNEKSIKGNAEDEEKGPTLAKAARALAASFATTAAKSDAEVNEKHQMELTKAFARVEEAKKMHN